MRGRLPGPGRWRWRLDLTRGADSALAALNLGPAGSVETGPVVELLDEGVFEIADEGGDHGGAEEAGAGPAAALRIDDAGLVDRNGRRLEMRSVVDLAQRTALAPGGDPSAGGVSAGDLALVDPLAAGVAWAEGRVFALDPAAIDRAAEAALAAARVGAVVGVSLGSVRMAAAGGGSRMDRQRSNEALQRRAETLLVREIVARFGAVDPLVWIAPDDARLGALAAAADGLGRPVLSALPTLSGGVARAARPPAATAMPEPDRKPETETEDDGAVAASRDARPRRPVSPPAAATSVLSTRRDGSERPEVSADEPTTPPVRRWLGDGQSGGEDASARALVSGQASAARAPETRDEAEPPVPPAPAPARKPGRISLSSFWPRPGRAGDSDADAAQRPAPEAPTPIRLRSDDRDPGAGEMVRTEGGAALELALYSMGDEALQTARRLDLAQRLSLGRILEDGLRLAVRLSGEDGDRVASLRLTTLDADGRSLTESVEPFEGMALFQRLDAEAANARTIVVEALGESGAPPLKRWTIACAPEARAPAAVSAPVEPARRRRSTPDAAARDALRLKRIDFTDPETDRLLTVWREGDVGPGPLPSQTTLTVSVAGDGVERSRRAVVTLAVRDAPAIRVEATPIVDDRGALCVFYDLALDGVADGLTLELFDDATAQTPFARLQRAP